jgi:hypothetical protein
VGCGLTIAFALGAKYWSWRKNKALEKEEERTGMHNPWRFAS